MCVLMFSTNFVRNISQSKKHWASYDKKCILVFMYSARYSGQTWTKLKISMVVSMWDKAVGPSNTVLKNMEGTSD